MSNAPFERNGTAGASTFASGSPLSLVSIGVGCVQQGQSGCDFLGGTKVFFWDTKCFFRETKIVVDILGGQRGPINCLIVLEILEGQKRQGWGSTVGDPKSSRKSSRKQQHAKQEKQHKEAETATSTEKASNNNRKHKQQEPHKQKQVAKEGSNTGKNSERKKQHKQQKLHKQYKQHKQQQRHEGPEGGLPGAVQEKGPS